MKHPMLLATVVTLTLSGGAVIGLTSSASSSGREDKTPAARVASARSQVLAAHEALDNALGANNWPTIASVFFRHASPGFEFRAVYGRGMMSREPAPCWVGYDTLAGAMRVVSRPDATDRPVWGIERIDSPKTTLESLALTDDRTAVAMLASRFTLTWHADDERARPSPEAAPVVSFVCRQRERWVRQGPTWRLAHMDILRWPYGPSVDDVPWTAKVR